MNTKISIKELPGFETKVTVGKVNVKEGQKIEKGDILLSLEGAKCTEDFKADINGTIKNILVEEGEEIEKGHVIAEIEEESDSNILNIELLELPGFETKVTVGKININKNDYIESGDVLLSLEGAKCTEDFKSPVSGKIIDILVDEGDEVEKNSQLLKIEAVNSNKNNNDMENKVSGQMTFKERYKAEVVVLGGGPGGYVAAIRASQNGKKVILIEEDTLGGTCLNRGCIPTKSMVQSTKVSDLIKNADVFGIEDASGLISMNKIIDRKEGVVNTLVSGLNASMKKHNIEVLNGRGKANDENSLLVNLDNKNVIVEFENLILAPGSVVSIPGFDGADEDDILTSDELLELRDIPESLIIIGGRVIAMEFAFIYQKLGTKVTVLQRSETIFPNLDDDVIEVVRKSAIDLGINLIEGTDVKSIKTTIDGGKAVVIEHNGVEKIVTAEKLAIATGRKPNLEGLDLEKLNVEISNDTWGIKVNDKMQTTNEKIYAIGDATNIYNLAHVASKHGIIAADNISGKNIEMDYSAIPEAVFTDPEIGLVGMSEKMCKNKNIEYIVGKFPYMANGKALVENDTEGFIKVIANKNTRKIIGASLIGLAATDLLSVFANLVHNKVDIDVAKDVVYAHPTVSETVFEAILDLDGESIHK